MNFPQALYINGSNIEPCTDDPQDWKDDPRGLLLMWEPAEPTAKYIMGMDPTQGTTGWTRATRTDGDHKIDNGAIEVFKVDGATEALWITDAQGNRIPDIDPVTKRRRLKYKDVQVAEFAAPCDAVEIARIANVIGRLYAGDAEEQCELIYEAWPGPGMLTTQELLRLGYTNLWMWEYIDSVAEETNRMGWRSTRESQKLLWYRARRHLMKGHAIIRSRYLLDEYSNAEIDLDKMRARASYGFHDDRFMATNLCFWAGHRWTYDVERTETEITATPVVDYQRMAPVLGEYESFSDWKRNATADWED